MLDFRKLYANFSLITSKISEWVHSEDDDEVDFDKDEANYNIYDILYLIAMLNSRC